MYHIMTSDHLDNNIVKRKIVNVLRILFGHVHEPRPLYVNLGKNEKF